MLIHDLAAFKAEHWGIAAKRRDKAVIASPLSAKIKNKRVLLVDDITDTGDTLRVSSVYLKRFRPREVRTAVLLHKACSLVIPDYFVRRITKWKWIVFPWHLWEDMTGFVQGIQAEGIDGADNISRELRKRYCIKLSIGMVKEILARLDDTEAPARM